MSFLVPTLRSNRGYNGEQYSQVEVSRDYWCLHFHLCSTGQQAASVHLPRCLWSTSLGDDVWPEMFQGWPASKDISS